MDPGGFESMKSTLQESLERGSSDVDWCETNYEFSAHIAEFFNVVSNIGFVSVPPLLMYVSRQYAQQVSWGINVVWALLMVVGMGSIYFHATLSLVGQLIDEIAILWVFQLALALWCPKVLLPACLKDRKVFMIFSLSIGMIGTVLAFMMPAINCLVLMIDFIPGLSILYHELKSCKSHRAYMLGVRTTVLTVVALFCWFTDRFYCNVWQSIGFPYMHCMWHILVFFAAYQACVLFAYFHAIAEIPDLMPQFSYWPYDSWTTLGIPFVKLRQSDATDRYKSL